MCISQRNLLCFVPITEERVDSVFKKFQLRCDGYLPRLPYLVKQNKNYIFFRNPLMIIIRIYFFLRLFGQFPGKGFSHLRKYFYIAVNTFGLHYKYLSENGK